MTEVRRDLCRIISAVASARAIGIRLANPEDGVLCDGQSVGSPHRLGVGIQEEEELQPP